jgi:hypothetical protein
VENRARVPVEVDVGKVGTRLSRPVRLPLVAADNTGAFAPVGDRSRTAERQDRRRRLLAWGCGCASAIVLLASIVALLNLATVKQLVRQAVAVVGELETVRSAVAGRFAAKRIHVNRKYSSRVDGPYLSVEVVDAPTLRDLEGKELEAEARQIAVLASEALHQGHPYRHLEIVVSRTVGLGGAVRDSEQFMFASSDLPLRRGQDTP